MHCCALNARFNRCATALPNLNDRIKFRRLRRDVGNQVVPVTACTVWHGKLRRATDTVGFKRRVTSVPNLIHGLEIDLLIY